MQLGRYSGVLNYKVKLFQRFTISKKITMIKKGSVLLILFYILTAANAWPQPAKTLNSAELQLEIEKLNVLGSVLYIGAHPDDENTGLIAYMSKGRKLRTAYLSLTRGDGGQNLIGSEKGSEIGLIRTQELLQARSLDGGEQYFTRAVDFGFSKTAEETFNKWGKDKILSDVVWVIRNFRPDVIITRFPIDGSGGHGHHTASAILAREAFRAAADPGMFPEQLKYVDTWQTKRIFWNNFRPSEAEIKGLLFADTGEFNPLIGKSYSEIAAESRSMHKSQGFGVLASRGTRNDYFTFMDGEPAARDVMDGVNTGWERVSGSGSVQTLLNDIIKNYKPASPVESLEKLMKLYGEINRLKSNYWTELKKKDLEHIIQSCAGLWIEAVSSEYSAAPGDEVTIKTSVINRAAGKFRLDKIELPFFTENSSNAEVQLNKPLQSELKVKIPASYPLSQPYWLEEKPSNGLFNVQDKTLIGQAENQASVPVRFHLSYGSEKIVFTSPLLFRWNDRVDGEKYRPFEIRPAVMVNFFNKAEVIPDNSSREIKVLIKCGTNNAKGEVRLAGLGKEWKVTPEYVQFDLKNRYDEQTVIFKVAPPAGAESVKLKAEITMNGQKFSRSLVEIIHSHIKPLSYFPESTIPLVKLNVKKFGGTVGYIMGSGDEIPECLANLGYNIVMLNDDQLEKINPGQFDAIITGVRAYNTRERFRYFQPRLMEYVYSGGTLIVQYNVNTGLQIPEIGPYPLKLSNERITVENSPVEFISPAHQLLNFPNKITQADFDGWTQERGLYFANQWDTKYETIISGHDPDEKDLKGGMLFTHYGKGIFIYSGYSWFRQLPDGVPGAYRIFVNMISAGKYNGKAAN